MIDDIRKLLNQDTFVPFIIHMADGRHIHVPTRNNILVMASRVIVTHEENDDYDLLPGAMMTGLTVDPNAVRSADNA